MKRGTKYIKTTVVKRRVVSIDGADPKVIGFYDYSRMKESGDPKYRFGEQATAAKVEVFINEDQVDALAMRAVRNRGKKATNGPVHCRVLDEKVVIEWQDGGES